MNKYRGVKTILEDISNSLVGLDQGVPGYIWGKEVSATSYAASFNASFLFTLP